MLGPELAADLAARFGTPLYAYDLGAVRERARALAACLPGGSRLLFSLKANPLPAIGAVLAGLGCGAEVSSTGELQAALAAGFAPAAILYTGPAKTPDEIVAALARGVRDYSCESFADLERLSHLAGQAGVRPRVLLRVNPARASRALLAMSGVRSQFGFEEELLLAEPARLAAAREVEIAGIHVYFGTQIQGAEALVSAFEEATDTAERIAEATGRRFAVLDLGGGFAWPFATAGEGGTLAGLAPALAALPARSRRNRGAELWFESGRYLTASSGTLLTTVLDVKASKGGNRFVLADTGIHHLGGMSGLGRIARSNLSVESSAAASNRPAEVVDLAGPLCTPLDCMGRNVTVPAPRPGDLLRIPNVGAYGLTASLMGFLSRPAPVEVVYEGTEILEASRLASARETLVTRAPRDPDGGAPPGAR
ncbi:MAG TPA: type III PLP-dependent enzyme [Thermoanaerobaculia bacterium]|jgi:diaminopimelate decarboxylase